MLVKDFLKVCSFQPNDIIDRSGNIYFLNGRKYAHFEEMEIDEVRNNRGYITIYLNSYGYDGEYEKNRI